MESWEYCFNKRLEYYFFRYVFSRVCLCSVLSLERTHFCGGFRHTESLRSFLDKSIEATLLAGYAEAGSTKHAAERSEGVAKAWCLIKGQVGPREQLLRKAQEPHKMPGV